MPQRTCLVEGCGRGGKLSLGLCRMHYSRVRRLGNTDLPPRASTLSCSIEGCDSSVFARGWCHKHWNRWRRHGDPLVFLQEQAPLAVRFWRKVDKRGPDECWEWTAHRSPSGYGRIGDGNGKGGETLIASRVSWELANGPIPEGLHVLHRCDNPPCCNAAHLFLGTNDDNVADMTTKDRVSHGSRHFHAKLTEQDVMEIRSSASKNGELAARYGVAPRTIRDARKGVTWRRVGGEGSYE